MAKTNLELEEELKILRQQLSKATGMIADLSRALLNTIQRNDEQTLQIRDWLVDFKEQVEFAQLETVDNVVRQVRKAFEDGGGDGEQWKS